jgi:hypothetical protein
VRVCVSTQGTTVAPLRVMALGAAAWKRSVERYVVAHGGYVCDVCVR